MPLESCNSIAEETIPENLVKFPYESRNPVEIGPVESGQNMYQRPSMIDNASLLLDNNCMILKPNLIEHHDYEALPQEVWKYILAWYSADWRIVRFLRRDAHQRTFLDLHPNEVDSTIFGHKTSTDKNELKSN